MNPSLHRYHVSWFVRNLCPMQFFPKDGSSEMLIFEKYAPVVIFRTVFT